LGLKKPGWYFREGHSVAWHVIAALLLSGNNIG
jgi:hypothetical protein